MGHITALWRRLSLALYCYYICDVTHSLEANGSSSLSFSLVHAEYLHGASKNSAFTDQSGLNSVIQKRNYSGPVHFSQETIHFTKIRSTDENLETFDGFQFVDSPDILIDAPPVSTDKISGGVDRGNGDMIGRDGSIIGGSGIIDKNVWKSYPNGTVIHDVHISLVHPANMAGVMNEGNLDGSAPVESKDSSSDGKMKTDISRGVGASTEPGANSSISEQDTNIHRPRPQFGSLSHFGGPSEGGKSPESLLDYVTNNATMAPFEQVFGYYSSTIAANSSKAHSMNDSTVFPPTVVTSTSAFDVLLATKAKNETINASSFTSGQMNSGGKFAPVINLGISINAKGPCLSECLTKCYTAESNAGINQATHLPWCLPSSSGLAIGGDVGLNVSDKPLEIDSTLYTASVPVLPIDGRSDAFENIGNLDSEVASGIEIRMLKTKESTEPKLRFLLEDVCLSESCVLKAADILRRMVKSADPCDSFYKFACGGYLKNEIPDGESSRSVFSDISSDIIARMYSVLKSPIHVSDYPAVKLLKKFYGKCILISKKELFIDALQELGGWPPNSPSQPVVPQHIWGEIAFNWTYGMFLEYNLVSINLTFANKRAKWTLNVDYPWFVKVALNTGSFSVLDEIERDVNIVAAVLGIDNSTTRSSLVEQRTFMESAIKYAKVTISSGEKGFHSLKDLKARFPHLDVMKKLPSLLKTAKAIDDSEMIYVSNMMYLQKVDDLLRDSTVRTQADHLILTAVRSWLLLIGTDNVPEKYCVKLTGKLFPHLDRHLYSSTFVNNTQVASATRIVSRIRDSLLHILNENGNETNKNELMGKVRKLMFIWSNREEINTDVLDGINRSFDESPSLLGFVKTGIRNLKKASYAYLHQRVNDSLASLIERYTEDDYGVNAFYHSQNVLIPSSALHESFFDPRVPSYVSYSGLGLIVGHELIHSLIEVGDFVNSVSYRNMEKCIINQFDKFTTTYSGDRVNGVLTKDDNIADYGGFKVAYHAFIEWYKRSSKGKQLPGLQTLNEKQMFWVTAATNWCQKVSPNFVATSIDKHAPPEYRIDGQFANIPEFALDFHCPENSPMNPKEKCSLW